MHFDRDDLLARTDLASLADQLLGGHRGNGRAARWPSPVPDHPQTGASPPMSIFRDRSGTERWTCFATGSSGTAIDLVMVATGRSAGEAIEWLAARAGAHPSEQARPRRLTVAPAPAGPSDALREYADACASALWQPAGRVIRRWLVENRGFDQAVLRRNRVGADPGRRTLPRARGLPWRAPGAVFPALDDKRGVVYAQLRYLHVPAGRAKYENPTAEHGANPRLSLVEPSNEPRSRMVVVAEGMPDALSAASAGFRAAAVLGAGLPNAAMADRLAALQQPVVVAFDADAAGRDGSTRLASLLAERRVHVSVLHPAHDDLNTWALAAGSDFARQLARSIDLTHASTPCLAVSR